MIPGHAYLHLIVWFLEYTPIVQPRHHHEDHSDIFGGDDLNTRRQEGLVCPDGRQEDYDIVDYWSTVNRGDRESVQTDPDSWRAFQRTTDSGKRHSRLLRFSRSAIPL